MNDLLFWVIAAAMLAATLGRLLSPLMRRESRPAASAASYDIAVYRDQLAELERDAARGLIGGTEAAAARLEIERRLLAAGRSASSAPGSAGGPRPALVAGLIVVLTAAALGLYLWLGSPGTPSLPFAERAAPGADNLASLVDQLARRLKDNPGDPQGWMLLGRSYGELGRFADSAAAYRAAVDRAPNLPGLQSAYGEALTVAAGGSVTEPARQAFAAALKQDAGDARARFYLALADAQAGHVEQALGQLVKLEAEGPADAPWLSTVRDEIERLARAAGKDPATLPGRRPPAAATTGSAPPLDDQTMAAAQAMTPEQRSAFVRSMVDRLAERLKQQPDDLTGWVRLAKAYGVLQQNDQARDAWRHAAGLAPDDSDVQLGYAEALLAAAGGTPPPEFAATAARVLAREPENRLALYYAGLAAAAAGHADEARRQWQRLLALMPADAPQRATLQRQIDGLGTP